MGPEILLTMLGFPINLLANFTYERIKQFSEKIKPYPFQNLFIKSFYKSLNSHEESFREGVKKLKKSIKKEEKKFMEIFNSKTNIYKNFLSALEEQTFQEEVACDIVEQFEVEENFKAVMASIVRECLTDYQEIFIKTISEKEGIQLILLFQGLNFDNIIKSIDGLNESIKSVLKRTIEKEAVEGKAIIERKIESQEAINELVQLINRPGYTLDKAVKLISKIGQFIIEQLDQDRFTTPEDSKGGWSKSYCNCLLPMLFQEKGKPEDTAPQDSITFTYFVIKALRSMERLSNILNLEAFDIEKLHQLLNEGREYLLNHYRNGEAGLITKTSMEEKIIAFHIRHTATFGKGLLEYPDEPLERIIEAFKTVYSKSKDAEERVPNHAEILSVLSILRSQRKLRGADVEDPHLEAVIADQEKKLLDRLICRNDKCFFEDTKATYKSSPFYTWWVLYCYGLSMKDSTKDYLRDGYNKVLRWVLSLEKKIDDKQSGFPLLIKEEPMVGMTAVLADTLVTLEGKKVRDLILRCINYILLGFESPCTLKDDFPFFYAYIFNLIENCIKWKIF